jgi:hypothetical protein
VKVVVLVMMVLVFLELCLPFIEEGTGCESGGRIAEETTGLLTGLGLSVWRDTMGCHRLLGGSGVLPLGHSGGKVKVVPVGGEELTNEFFAVKFITDA